MRAIDRLQLRETPPQDELCHCPPHTPVNLQFVFTEFPVFCTGCAGQAMPADFALPDDLAQEILRWMTLYSALFQLWLDSSDYETFAANALLDPNGEVNRLGRQVAARLNIQRPTYYLWFSDNSEIAPEKCPVCHGPLKPWPHRPLHFCDGCRISV
jgi:Zn-ribbon-containing, possibly nucleic-acid-binding protein (DUF2310)